MPDKKPLPAFANETEEARWYYEHRDELGDYFGTLAEVPPYSLGDQLGLVRSAKRPAAPKAPSEQISLRLPHDDLDALKAIADRKGLGYQTLIKSALHEYVLREQAAG
jgi:uncharacterized protein (DUF4415 family)